MQFILLAEYMGHCGVIGVIVREGCISLVRFRLHD